MLITRFFAIGGEELSTLSIALELKKRGHRVFWMSSNGPLIEELKRNDVDCLRANMGKRNILSFIMGTHDIWKFVRLEAIDIIHSQSAVPTIMSFLARLAPLSKSIRILWHDRGLHDISYPIVGQLFNYAADFVITNSNHERGKLLKDGLKPARVRTIHNCLNMPLPSKVAPDHDLVREFKINQKDYIIGTVRRLHPEKGGHYDLLKCAAEVLKDFPKAKFIIIGGGPLETQLRNFASKLNIEDNVIFTGFRRDLEKFYSIMDIFVLPSTWEPLGNVLVEAMAFGKPVVATNVGGIPEVVVDNETGILVPPADPSKLAEALLYLLQNPDIAKRLGEAGKKRVSDYFTIERLADELEEVYSFITS